MSRIAFSTGLTSAHLRSTRGSSSAAQPLGLVDDAGELRLEQAGVGRAVALELGEVARDLGRVARPSSATGTGPGARTPAPGAAGISSAHRLQEVGHLDGHAGGLGALDGGTLPRLLLGAGGEHRVGDRHAGLQLHLDDAARALVRRRPRSGRSRRGSRRPVPRARRSGGRSPRVRRASACSASGSSSAPGTLTTSMSAGATPRLTSSRSQAVRSSRTTSSLKRLQTMATASPSPLRSAAIGGHTAFTCDGVVGRDVLDHLEAEARPCSGCAWAAPARACGPTPRSRRICAPDAVQLRVPLAHAAGAGARGEKRIEDLAGRLVAAQQHDHALLVRAR